MPHSALDSYDSPVMLGVVLCVCVRHFHQPSVSWRELAFPVRLWLPCRALRRRAVSGAFCGRRTYRSQPVRSHAFCARRGFSVAVVQRRFRFAAGVGLSSGALRRCAAVFPALCARESVPWPTSLVLPRSSPGDRFGAEEFPAARRFLPSLCRGNSMTTNAEQWRCS